MKTLQEYQVKDAKFQLLYNNEWSNGPANRVCIELAGWSVSCLREALIMTSTATVDGKVIFEDNKVMDCSVADAIDAAVKQYTDLLKAHPGYEPNNERE